LNSVRIWSICGPFWGRVICIINDILSNKTTKCLIQTISVMFNRIYSLKFQKIQNSQFQLEQFKISLKRAFTDNFRKKNSFFLSKFRINKVAISCNQFQSVAINCNQLQSIAISCNQLQSSCNQLQCKLQSIAMQVAINCNQLQSSCNQLQAKIFQFLLKFSNFDQNF